MSLRSLVTFDTTEQNVYFLEDSHASAEDAAQKRGSRLQRFVKMLLVAQDFVSASRGNPRSSRRLTARKFSLAPSLEEQVFTSSILTAHPVMTRSSKLMQRWGSALGMRFLSHRASLPGGLEGDGKQTPLNSPSELMAIVVETIHQTKISVARAAWKSMSGPMDKLRDEVASSKRRYETLKQQFDNARTSYLKEVSALRDEVRHRADPSLWGGFQNDASDVKFFVDPLHMLSPGELEFANAVIVEKLKMIFEANPCAAKMVDFAQVDTVKDHFLTQENDKMRNVIEQKLTALTESERERRRQNKELSVLERRLWEAKQSKQFVKEDLQAHCEQLVEETHEQIKRAEAWAKKCSDLETAIAAAEAAREETQAELKRSQQALLLLEAKHSQALKDAEMTAAPPKKPMARKSCTVHSLPDAKPVETLRARRASSRPRRSVKPDEEAPDPQETQEEAPQEKWEEAQEKQEEVRYLRVLRQKTRALAEEPPSRRPKELWEKARQLFATTAANAGPTAGHATHPAGGVQQGKEPVEMPTEHRHSHEAASPVQDHGHAETSSSKECLGLDSHGECSGALDERFGTREEHAGTEQDEGLSTQAMSYASRFRARVQQLIGTLAASTEESAAVAADFLHEHADTLCDTIARLATVLQSEAASKARMQERLSTLSGQVNSAAAALQNSPALKVDHNLEMVLQQMHGAQDVFCRLYADARQRCGGAAMLPPRRPHTAGRRGECEPRRSLAAKCCLLPLAPPSPQAESHPSSPAAPLPCMVITSSLRRGQEIAVFERKGAEEVSRNLPELVTQPITSKSLSPRPNTSHGRFCAGTDDRSVSPAVSPLPVPGRKGSRRTTPSPAAPSTPATPLSPRRTTDAAVARQRSAHKRKSGRLRPLLMAGDGHLESAEATAEVTRAVPRSPASEPVRAHARTKSMTTTDDPKEFELEPLAAEVTARCPQAQSPVGIDSAGSSASKAVEEPAQEPVPPPSPSHYGGSPWPPASPAVLLFEAPLLLPARSSSVSSVGNDLEGSCLAQED